MKTTAGTIGSSGFPTWSKLLLVLGLLAAAAGTVRFAQGQSPGARVVNDVLIVGSLNPQQVKASLRTRSGMAFDEAIVREDLAMLGSLRIAKEPHYERQDIEGTNLVNVTFFVNEYPNLIRDVVYKNAHHARAEELDAIIGNFIKRGNPLNPNENRQACLRIVDYYKKEGRYFASCTLEEGSNASDLRVVFNITEGPIVRVRNIGFTGNDSLATAAQLRTQTDTWARLLCFEMLSSKFNPLMIDSDASKLQDYYRSNGYLDARVTRELAFTDDHQFVDVTYHITEGIRYHVNNVTVAGTHVLPQDQVLSILKLHKDDLYDQRVVDADVRNIGDLYGYRGYPAVVRPVVDAELTPGVVRVNYVIDERAPFKVGEIVIVGNDVTKNRIILRELQDILPGQTIRYPDLRDGEKRLQRLNIFEGNEDRPTISVIERDDNRNSEYKDVLVKVKETMTGSLMFGASVNSDAGLVGSIVLNERNFDICRPPTSIEDVLEGRAFRGAGQELRIEAVPGTEVQRYSISFREPKLFDLPYSLTTGAYYFDRVYNEYTEGRTGMNVMVGHQLNRFWSVSAGVRVENVNISNVPFWAPTDFTSVQGDNFLVAPRVTVARDDRDSFLRPTEGGIVSFTYEQLLGEFTSPVLTLEASRFFTTYQRPDGSGRHVVALRSQVAWTGDDTPVYERFYAGGIRSLRGFEFRGVGPIVNGFNLGGDFMFLNSVEYQLPVLANDQLYFVGFVDSGTVEQSVTIQNYRVAAGVGARILVPMLGPVPIALDFGFPIVRAATDREQIFSFYVGLSR